jgi:hypothetical protein
MPFLKKIDEELERLLPENGRQHVIIRGADHGMFHQKPQESCKAILDYARCGGRPHDELAGLTPEGSEPNGHRGPMNGNDDH